MRVLRLGGWSPHVQTEFHVFRPTQGSDRFLPVRGYHPLWPAFPDRSRSYCQTTGLVPVRSPLLRESRLMSFPPGTEMFHFPGFASLTYVFSQGYLSKEVGFPIRKSADQCLMAANRSLSQPITSVIAFIRQGIHQMLLLTLEL